MDRCTFLRELRRRSLWSHLPPNTPGSATLELVPVAIRFSTPLDVQQPDDTAAVLVVEQAGTFRSFRAAAVVPAAPFLDVTGRPDFTSGGETGCSGCLSSELRKPKPPLLRKLTRNNGTQLQTVIAEFTASAATRISRTPRRKKFSSPWTSQPGSQRRRACLGKDGLLYIGLGDGGGEGDPSGNGQNTNTLLGKMLRIAWIRSLSRIETTRFLPAIPL